jgi:thiamine biosynthesis lipoprotein
MRKWLGFLLFVGAMVGVVFFTRSRSARTFTIRGFTMGTSYTVHVASTLDDDEERRLRRRVQDVVDAVNRRMSTYQPNSEVSRFNRYESDDWFDVSDSTAHVVATALDVGRQTNGAFDITVAPLVNLWSFGPDQRPLGVPLESEVSAALQTVDFRKLHVRMDPPALRKEDPRLSIDLSGIAKGYAVDRLSAQLERDGFPSHMVEIGGEVRTRGAKLDGQAWKIGLERPDVDRRTVQFVMKVTDCCLASSGDYRNFFEWEGKFYSHEIDPRIGWPVQNGAASVSVVASSVMLADALATALMVLSPEEAWDLANESDWELLLVTRQADGSLVSRQTPGFPLTHNPGKN